MCWPIIFCLIIDMLGFKSNIMIFFLSQSPFIWYCAISGCFHFSPPGFCTVLSYYICFKPIIHCYHFCLKQLIIFKRNLDTRKGLYIYPHSYHFWCSSFLCKVRFPCDINSVSAWRTSFHISSSEKFTFSFLISEKVFILPFFLNNN